jgi:ribosome-binding protein aMBF1 (putative translation factor)
MVWRGPTQLYRHFSASGELLYVGAGPCVLCRIHARRHAIWFPEIASITVRMCKSRKAALAAETKAIKTEHPKHNIRDTPRMKIVEARNYVAVDALKAVRERRGISLMQLSEKSGIDQGRINAYERGRVRVRPPTAKKLSEALRCRISTLSATPASVPSARKSIPSWDGPIGLSLRPRKRKA